MGRSGGGPRGGRGGRGQGLLQLGHAGIAVGSPEGGALAQDLLMMGRQARYLIPGQIHSVQDPLGGLHGHPAREAVEERAAEGIDVGPGAQIALALVLLDRGEAVLQDRLGGLEVPLAGPGVLDLPDRAEVQQLRAAHGMEDDVVGADVPVDHAGLVDLGQGVDHRIQEPEGLLGGQPAAPECHELLKTGALHIFHDDVGGAVGLEEALDADDRRHALESGQGLGLPEEPLQAGPEGDRSVLGGGEDAGAVGPVPGDQGGGIELLHRHLHIQIPVPAEIGDAEATLAQGPSDHILVPEQSAHAQLVGLVIAARVPAAPGTDAPLQGLHTAVAKPIRHVPFLLFLSGSIIGPKGGPVNKYTGILLSSPCIREKTVLYWFQSCFRTE